MITLKPSATIRALRTTLAAGRPTFLWGPPGIGKSKCVAQVAKELGLELRDVRATLLDPVDLRGLPNVKNGRTQWNPPEFLPREGNGVLFLDELNASPQAVQTACYQLILDRRLGEYELPQGWTVLAAGNRLADSAAAARMSTALSNRFVHIEMHADLDDWINWALKNGIDPNIIAYLKWRPDNLHQHNKDSRAFPTPRSWEFASQILQAEPDRAVEQALLAGTIGEGCVAEFYGFIELARKLPNIEDIWAHPEDEKKAPVPKEPSCRYAVAFALAVRCKKENLKATLKYLRRLPLEYNLLATKALSERDSNLCNSDFAEHVRVSQIGEALSNS